MATFLWLSGHPFYHLVEMATMKGEAARKVKVVHYRHGRPFLFFFSLMEKEEEEEEEEKEEESKFIRRPFSKFAVAFLGKEKEEGLSRQVEEYELLFLLFLSWRQSFLSLQIFRTECVLVSCAVFSCIVCARKKMPHIL